MGFKPGTVKFTSSLAQPSDPNKVYKLAFRWAAGASIEVRRKDLGKTVAQKFNLVLGIMLPSLKLTAIELTRRPI